MISVRVGQSWLVKSRLMIALCLAIAAFGCVRQQILSDPEVRKLLAEGRATHKSITEKISNLLASYAVVQPLSMVINEPYSLPVQEVFSKDMQPLMGLYEENPNVPGDFSKYIYSPGAATVVFNSGIKVTLSGLRYNSAGRLISHSIDVSSSTQVPVMDKVTMKLTEERLNALGFLPGVESGGLRMTGDVTMIFEGASATYKVNRGIGTYTDPELTSSHGQGRRYHLFNRSTNEFWREDGVLTYIPSQVYGVWAGLIGSDTYSDNNVSYDANIILQNGIPNGAEANYVRGTGRVSFAGATYATLTGGPYSCDLNRTGLIGFGTEIRMTYQDGTAELVMPSETFTCSKTAIPDPTGGA